jgi:hypothetical protein
MQTAGDCQVNQCDGLGNPVTAPDNTDVPADDGIECTLDVCSNGAPSHPPASAGAPCSQSGGVVCSGAGACVECVSGGMCPSGVCASNQCAAATCTDTVKNGTETDVDCGGLGCPPCASGQMCVVGSDCQTSLCSGGVCQGPTCSDGVKNGTETGIDCGGTCSGCPAGGMCIVSADCLSGVCSGGVCAAPVCTDGVKNGTETDVDCGGGCPSPCADGLACVAGSDCASGVCGTNVCQAPSCLDAVKNGLEVGLDCGGPCPMCHLVINEIDYDQVGTDTNEYIEIYNGTGADVSLSGLQLRFVNGSTNTVYLTVDLTPGGTLLNGEYLVVASGTVVVPASAKKILFAAGSNNIQNGAPDGVALVNTTSTQVIDVLSYAGSMTMANLGAPFGVVSLVEGTALPAVTVDDGLSAKSLNRKPNGLDHNNAATDWALSTTLTPGAANVP